MTRPLVLTISCCCLVFLACELPRPAGAQTCTLQVSGLPNRTLDAIFDFAGTSAPDEHNTYGSSSGQLGLQFEAAGPAAKHWAITSYHLDPQANYAVYAKCVSGCEDTAAPFPTNPSQPAKTSTWELPDGNGGAQTEAARIGCCAGQTFPCEHCKEDDCEQHNMAVCKAKEALGSCCYYDGAPLFGKCRCSTKKTDCADPGAIKKTTPPQAKAAELLV